MKDVNFLYQLHIILGDDDIIIALTRPQKQAT